MTTTPTGSNTTEPIDPPEVDAAAWRAARLDHLAAEKAFTAARDELTEARRALPWLAIIDDYRFTQRTPDGDVERTLADLFDGNDQLLVYHFMMGPDWEEGCPSCSFWADNYDGTLEHLAARNTALVAVSRAPVEAIEDYRARMGWRFPWVSSLGSEFNFDLGVSFTAEQVESGEADYNFGTGTFGGPEAPGLSAFRRLPPTETDGPDRVYLTYQTFARGLDMLNGTYHLLDVTSLGRDEADLPWPMAWLRRHDRY
ncbi:MAG: DUF899 domain-containing protein [Actinomycetota bacterium]